MTTRTRKTLDEIHANHHRLINERVGTYRSLPRRSGLDKVRRREALKQAWHDMRGHLTQCHAKRGQALGPTLTLDEMIAMHDQLHGDG